MKTEQNICESCKKRPVEKLEHSDKGLQPYHLCKQCQYRLFNYALRPLEFFNLVAIYGHGYYLHDDFYDYKNGEATQPKTDVEEPGKFPFPDSHSINTDLEKAVNFACVQYFTSSEVIELLKKFNKKAVLHSLVSKVNYNRSINYKAYEIAAKVLGLYAADWIRQQWKKRKEDELLIFAPALAACLPFDEAFAIVTTEIRVSAEKSFANNSSALLFFKSSKTLDWLEKFKDQIINVSPAWGVLTASSMFDWQRAKKWLDVGRPLSLVALDALVYCTTTSERHNQVFWFRENSPTLFNPAKPEEIASALTAYLEKDSVHRTKNAVRQIINNLFGTVL